MDANKLFSLAEQRLDENQYDDAAALFQTGAEAQQPSCFQLTNWGITVELAYLSKLKHVSAKYPNSLDCQLAVATHLLKIGMSGQALALCSQMLSVITDPKAAVQFRLLRFRSGIASKKPELMRDDFLHIWNAGIEAKPRALIRSRLLRDIASLVDDTFVHLLEQLHQSPIIDHQSREFLFGKMQEIKLLTQATVSLANQSTGIRPISP